MEIWCRVCIIYGAEYLVLYILIQLFASPPPPLFELRTTGLLCCGLSTTILLFLLQLAIVVTQVSYY
jgi:hypothetical protein